MKPVVLASASPRRVELLSRFGIPVHQRPVHIDESVQDDEEPKHYAIRMAKEKARACLEKTPGEIILAADTIVVIDKKILLKPRSNHEAEDMLTALSGTWHSVFTSMHLCYEKCATFISETRVKFKQLNDELIQWYIETDEPWDKAGGYGIQGRASLFVDRIDGDYETVMGLSVRALPELFEQCELNLFEYIN